MAGARSGGDGVSAAPPSRVTLTKTALCLSRTLTHFAPPSLRTTLISFTGARGGGVGVSAAPPSARSLCRPSFDKGVCPSLTAGALR